MSEEFEVRGIHDEHLDQAAEREPKSMAGQLAVMTAVLATIGAIFSYMAGLTQAEAALLKNSAGIKKTEASNQWSYYQAKSYKQNLSALGNELVGESRKPYFEGEVKRYKEEAAEIKVAAEKLDKESTEFDEKSEARMHQHHRWAQATTLLQISIAMAAIALLTRRKWLGKTVLVVSTVGVMLGALAYLHI